MRDVRDDVLAALRAPRLQLPPAPGAVPDRPGLYAIYGASSTWAQFELDGPAPDPDLPLYVGKAEDSLIARDLRTHFGDGRTGQSTVRRSFAALLAPRLGLRGIPRNQERPDRFSNFGLSPNDDAGLTAWMHANLRLAVWPADGPTPLVEVERKVLRTLNPPLNLTHVTHRWTRVIKQRRKVLADQARAWTPAR